MGKRMVITKEYREFIASLNMKKFYLFFRKNKKVPQAVGQIPWGHIRVILNRIKDLNEAGIIANFDFGEGG